MAPHQADRPIAIGHNSERLAHSERLRLKVRDRAPTWFPKRGSVLVTGSRPGRPYFSEERAEERVEVSSHSERHPEELSRTPRLEYADERADESFWQAAKPDREPIRTRWFVPAVILLLVFNVPWYLPGTLESRLVGGLPLWTWIALATSLLLSVVTACASLWAWRDED